jgi:hypothetical protein
MGYFHVADRRGGFVSGGIVVMENLQRPLERFMGGVQVAGNVLLPMPSQLDVHRGCASKSALNLKPTIVSVAL